MEIFSTRTKNNNHSDILVQIINKQLIVEYSYIIMPPTVYCMGPLYSAISGTNPSESAMKTVAHPVKERALTKAPMVGSLFLHIITVYFSRTKRVI